MLAFCCGVALASVESASCGAVWLSDLGVALIGVNCRFVVVAVGVGVAGLFGRGAGGVGVSAES